MLLGGCSGYLGHAAWRWQWIPWLSCLEVTVDTLAMLLGGGVDTMAMLLRSDSPSCCLEVTVDTLVCYLEVTVDTLVMVLGNDRGYLGLIWR